MASGRGGVHVSQLKQISVPESFIEGCKFVKWDDDTPVGITVVLKVDPAGFFLHWTDQNGDTEFLEISSIRDTRTGRYAKMPRNEGRLKESINIGPLETPLEEKTLTVVYGPDFVNVNFINFCTYSRDIAELWTDELLKMAYNLLSLNASVYTFLHKSHTKLLLGTDREDKLPVKNVIKMFAIHKDDKKRVEKALENCDQPYNKNDSIVAKKFTMEKFFTFYKHLVGRTEVRHIFDRICNKNTQTSMNTTSSMNATNTNNNTADESEVGSKDRLMTANQFVHFLNREQRDPRLNEILYPYADQERGKDLIEQYEPNRDLAAKGLFSFDGFLRYLMSTDNAIVAPDKFDLNNDMDQPLSHYFINSSHNTYLTGHQLTGKSSVEIYRQCLLAGCRCIELDCWNGRSDDEPIITHGYTVVTDVPFKEVLEAINESAFKTSDYPVILSFENRCSSKQQAKMAAYCRKIFGDSLLTEPLPSHPLKPGVPLPAPNLLLRKIIIKNKKKHYKRRRKQTNVTTKVAGIDQTVASQVSINNPTPGTPTHTTTTSSNNVSPTTSQAAQHHQHHHHHHHQHSRPELLTSNSDDSTAHCDSEEILSSGSVTGSTTTTTTANNSSVLASVVNTGSTTNSASMSPGSSTTILKNSSCDMEYPDSDSSLEDDDVNEEHSIAVNNEYGNKEAPIGSEMSELVIYVQPIRFHTFEIAEKRDRSFEVSSFDETQSTSLLKERPVDFVNYNKRQLSRIYPRGTRVNSSNYMPQIFWNAGCQMAALNFQTLDLGMQLNLGIFEYNGRNGYLLKPDFMRRLDRRFDPFTESTVDGIIAGSVSIKIISGQFLSNKRVGTYVEVDMYGLPADTVRRRRTKIVPANGLNPVYDEEPFLFKKVVLPDLACLRIAAFEENGKFIGTRILPVVGLRPGYRHISLRNECQQPLSLPTLFVQITVRDYVPDGLYELADALANPIAYQSMVEKHAKQLLALTDDAEDDGSASGGIGNSTQNAARKNVSATSDSAFSSISASGRICLGAIGAGGSFGGNSSTGSVSAAAQDNSEVFISGSNGRTLNRETSNTCSDGTATSQSGPGSLGCSPPNLSRIDLATNRVSSYDGSTACNSSSNVSNGTGVSSPALSKVYSTSSKVASPSHKNFVTGTGSGSSFRRQDTITRKLAPSLKSYDDYPIEKSATVLESSDARLIAEPVEKLKNTKAYQKAYAKWERDLAALQKKFDKQRDKCRESYTAEQDKANQWLEKQRKLVQSQHRTGSSVSTLAGSGSKSFKKYLDSSKRPSIQDIEICKEEYRNKIQEIQRSHSEVMLNHLLDLYREAFRLFEGKHYEQLCSALEKATTESQQSQIQHLNSLHDKEVVSLMKRLDNQNKEELLNLSKTHKDKNELARIKRELQQRLIDQAVVERQRFKQLLDKRTRELTDRHHEVKQKIEEEKRNMLSEKRQDYEQCNTKLRSNFEHNPQHFLEAAFTFNCKNRFESGHWDPLKIVPKSQQ